LQNWDEDLNKIMQRKMEQYQAKISGKQTNYNIDKESHHNIPLILTDYNFTEAINKYKFLIVDFWAAWCGPCKMVSPIIEQLSVKLAGKALFGKLNVDENPNVSNSFGIQSIPTIMIFKNGQVVDRIIGAMTESQLILKISPHID
jgi:thioredoxin 1